MLRIKNFFNSRRTNMATNKKNNYINVELQFAEEQLAQWKEYLNKNPISEITDRWGKKEMPKGGYAMVVTSTAEQQIKCVQDTTVRYLELLRTVNQLREIEEDKKDEIRGDQDLSPFESGDI